jgi:hypothetical protein
MENGVHPKGAGRFRWMSVMDKDNPWFGLEFEITEGRNVPELHQVRSGKWRDVVFLDGYMA